MPSRNPQYTFRLDPDADADIIALLESVEPGLRAHTIRKLLRAAVRQETSHNSVVDLAEIRSVVEAAVESALARWEGLVRVQAAQESDPEETERLLDGLGEALML